MSASSEKGDAATEASGNAPDGATLTALRRFIADNEMDYNFPQGLVDRAREFLRHSHTTDLESAQGLMADIEQHNALARNHSAYAEVRAVVDATDDPTELVATFRVFVMGTIFSIAGSAIEQFFALRMPTINMSPYMVQLVSMPFGVLLAKALPARTFGQGTWWAFSLNPGPFTQKEHLLIAMMGNVTFGARLSGAYINSIVQVLKLPVFYGETTLANSIPWQVCTLLSTQLMGYGCAGMARRFLVYPPAMIWQRPLAIIALTKALHKDHGQNARAAVNGWTMSRYRFFVLCFSAMFVYYWVPNYLFQALALFNWITWISPRSVVLAIITGASCGLGINPLPTLDWNIATYLGDPIITPLFTIMNLAAGMALTGFLVAPFLYFNNVWNGAHLPINTNKIYDNKGNVYNVHRVLKADMTLDQAAYRNYSIPWLSTMQILNYVSLFAMYASIPAYICLHYRKAITTGVKSLTSRKPRCEEFTDVQNRLMCAYKECPHWWYLGILVLSFILACVSVSMWPTGMPIWGIVVAVGFTILVQIPLGMLWAITNMEVPTSILALALGGYVLEGKPVPNMMFKMFSFMSTSQSLNFTADLKLAHYGKIPPRWAFAAQVYATLIAGFVSLAVNHWVLDNMEDLCTESQKDRFTCPHAYSFFKASVIWGVIGPRRLFGPDGPYAKLVYAVPAGAVLPVLVHLLHRRWRTSWLRNVNVPVFLAGPMCWSPFNWSYMQGTVMLALFFNFFVKRRHLLWWERYAYVMTSSFTAAIGMAGLAMFFTLQKWDIRLDWWGNRVGKMGVDMGGLREAGQVVKCVFSPEEFASGF
ncbi:uncharacterized protein UV8b_03347 [Ustilaginoidea virens]|uniref:Uncharacterized protein n=1 Tax=Ustilaginoidea virens TaxID=1159556 RepID=A0A063BQX2_USTVR|nr:uncharacterized protein UV8b_03347 [Ustilaginoidea virens]QUC19106.1 hypothetical protein UV8b_03347 [Ustilaginoidea virens]GAO19985.1 hypothetical protein UVI_02063320 [Ustilaginoidea virens]